MRQDLPWNKEDRHCPQQEQRSSHDSTGQTDVREEKNHILFQQLCRQKQVASWPETMQGGFKTLFVVSHKEAPYRQSNKQHMQCLMTWHLETEQHEPRINADANAAEKEMKEFELICSLLGGRGECR